MHSRVSVFSVLHDGSSTKPPPTWVSVPNIASDDNETPNSYTNAKNQGLEIGVAARGWKALYVQDSAKCAMSNWLDDAVSRRNLELHARHRHGLHAGSHLYWC